MNCIVDFIVNCINRNDVDIYIKIVYLIMTDGHTTVTVTNDRNVIMFMSHKGLKDHEKKIVLIV